jgi:hypothetical protein
MLTASGFNICKRPPQGVVVVDRMLQSVDCACASNAAGTMAAPLDHVFNIAEFRLISLL